MSQDFRHRSCSCLIQVSLSPPSPSTQVLALTTHAVPAVRVRALKEMCPCRVKGDIARFWDRVLEMTHDEDPGTPCCSSCPERYICEGRPPADSTSSCWVPPSARPCSCSHVCYVRLRGEQRFVGRCCTPCVTAPPPTWRTPSWTRWPVSTGTRTRSSGAVPTRSWHPTAPLGSGTFCRAWSFGPPAAAGVATTGFKFRVVFFCVL